MYLLKIIAPSSGCNRNLCAVGVVFSVVLRICLNQNEYKYRCSEQSTTFDEAFKRFTAKCNVCRINTAK